jgi:TolB-like 6-blade propeller-like
MTAHRSTTVLALALATGCGHGPSGWPLDHLADGTVAIANAGLHPENPEPRLLLSDTTLGVPWHLGVQGNRLWVADHSGNPYLHVVDIPSGRIIFSAGQHGEGPGDFEAAPQFTRRPGDAGAIWAYDYVLKRLMREVDTPTRGYAIDRPPQAFVEVNSYLWLSRNRLVGIGDMDTNRVILSDTSGDLVAVREADLLGPDSVPLLARRAASGGFVACAGPAVQRFAVLYQLGGRIDIFDSAGRFVTHAQVPFPTNGEWALSPRHQSLWAQPDWFFYIDCDATPRYLYALFAGHRTDGPNGGRIKAARYVHVFDWDGHLVKVIGLGHEMSTIAVSGDSLLFAAGLNGEGIFEYHLEQ